MKTPPIPANEDQRLSALKEYQILDTLPEKVYDDITKIASVICGTPIALVSLIDNERQWFKSHHGLDVQETPKNLAYCAHAINKPDTILEVPDAYKDDRFHDNPLATGEPFVRFYAGAPLTDTNGYTLGTLCVIDHEERHLTAAQKESLWSLSRQVVALLELRKENLLRKQSEEDFNSLLESIDDGVFELDENGVCIYANHKMVEMLGRTLEEVLNTSIWDMIYHEDVPEMQAFYGKQFKSRSAKCRYEYRIQPKAGNPIWISQNTTMVYEGKRMVKLRSISRDISETKAIEKKLATKESLYRLVSENSTDLIALHELDGTYKFVSPSVLDILGFEPEELIGTNPYQLICEDDKERLQKGPHQQTLNGNSIQNVEYRLKKKDGSYIWMQSYTTPIKNEKGEVTSFQTSSRNINNRKIEELKLTRHLTGLTLINALASQPDSDELLTNALDKVSDYLGLEIGIISRIEGDHYFVEYSNHLNEAISDTKKYSLSKTMPAEVFSDDRVLMTDSRVQQKTLHPCFPELTKLNYIGACISKDGEKYGTIDFFSAKTADRQFSSYDREFLMLFTNWVGSILVSQEEKEQLRRARKHAEAASEAKASFLSMMSHEIRTPLNGIIGTTHLLMNKSPSEVQLPHLRVLEQSSHNLMSIVNDILDFGKIEEGKIQIEKIPFNLREHVYSIFKNYEIQGIEKGISVVLSYSDDLADFYEGDSVRIGQILHNLISNAIKFTEQGQVSISLALTNHHNNFEEIEFKIKDSGIGIPAEKQKEIFGEFIQADKSTTRKFGGSGLGLSITKKLLKLMESEIKVESMEGLGSVFSFRLIMPRSNEPSTNQNSLEKVGEFKALNIHILLVEDNTFNRAIAKEFLESWGCTCKEAENGQVALELIEKERFDLVLLDLQMPVLDGYETIEIIRSHKTQSIREVSVFALTAAALGDVESKVYQSGMDNFITKPFHPSDFYQKLSTVLSNQEKLTSNVNYKKQIIDKLQKTLGSDETETEQYFDVFIQTLKDELEVLKASLRGENLLALKAYGHKNKSSLLLGGLSELANEAEEMEQLVTNQVSTARIIEKATKHKEHIELVLKEVKTNE